LLLEFLSFLLLLLLLLFLASFLGFLVLFVCLFAELFGFFSDLCLSLCPKKKVLMDGLLGIMVEEEPVEFEKYG